MSNTNLHGDQARKELQSGANKLANMVKATLGPAGRNIVIQRRGLPPHVTKDGVTVAKNIQLEDYREDVGASLILQAAATTVNDAGDGTTTSTVLAQAMINKGVDYVNAGYNPTVINKGIDRAVKMVADELASMAIDINSDNEEIKHVATISANGDDSIGKLIADAMKIVGNNGVITVEEATGMETTIEVVPGLQIDRGYRNPYFMNNTRKGSAEYEKPAIILHDQEISTIPRGLMRMLGMLLENGRPVVLIASDIKGEALSSFIGNKSEGAPVLAIEAPGYGPTRQEALEDIAFMTGCKVVSDDNNVSFDDIANMKSEEEIMQYVGTCGKIECYGTRTVFIDGSATDEEARERADELLARIEEGADEANIEHLRNRAASLTGGVATMKVGGTTQVEMKERKDRVDDSLSATRSSIEEGIVPGGGTAYIKCLKALSDTDLGDRELNIGKEIVMDAIIQPIKSILLNCGFKEEQIFTQKKGWLMSLFMTTEKGIINKVAEGDDRYGYDAREEVFGDLIELGVIDPKKVTRCALENAASAAKMLLTTEGLIVENPSN